MKLGEKIQSNIVLDLLQQSVQESLPVRVPTIGKGVPDGHRFRVIPRDATIKFSGSTLPTISSVRAVSNCRLPEDWVGSSSKRSQQGIQNYFKRSLVVDGEDDMMSSTSLVIYLLLPHSWILDTLLLSLLSM
ncbi:hypothetical protein FOZ62_016298, partial [Perkinsus olseni]